MAIVDKKMKNRLDSPLHAAAYMLNPYYSYNNPAIFSDSIVVEKFMQCVETFYYGEDGKEYRAVNEDREKFQKRHGSFSRRQGDVNALSSIRVSCCNHFCPNFFAINFAHV